ncbi:MAG TPA: glycosyltransferase family 2 protein [Thermoanaerobaculia bacterium]|nr:glycosyltransferase family 2 protein [Thermoanaerobaculia bacterium]
MSPEVTAVVTTHGRPLHVQEALASLSAETHRDIEIVVVDDGGAFDPGACSRDVPLRVVRGSDLGVGRARNLGLSAARGEFVIFLDDDDVALPHRISRLVAAARNHRASLCFGMTRRVGGPSEILECVPTHLRSPGAVEFCDVLTCAPHVNAVLVRTETLRSVGGFDAGATHFDDWSAWLRIADRNAVIWSLADTVAEWRIHAHGLSAHILRNGAMKVRLLSLFERLESCLSVGNARAAAAARSVVASAEILTYDDYAGTMAGVRERLHSGATCFGDRSCRRAATARVSVA